MIALLAAALAADPALPPGRYGMELWVATAADLPIVGESRGESVSWLLVDVAWDGQALAQSHRACRMEVLNGPRSSRVSVSDGFLAASGQARYAVSAAPGGAYRADLGLQVVGYDPRLSSVLPETLDDPAVLDWDGDGRPAATVRVDVPVWGSAEIYVVQRARMTLDGALQPGGGARGRVRLPVFEQRTLGASSDLFAVNLPIRSIEAESGFVLAPVPPQTGCADLAAALCAQGAARPASCSRLTPD